jgi:hypothetical protein
MSKKSGTYISMFYVLAKSFQEKLLSVLGMGGRMWRGYAELPIQPIRWIAIVVIIVHET